MMSPSKKIYTIRRSLTVRELADSLNKPPYEIIAEFLDIKIFTQTVQPLTSEQLRAYSERYGVTFTLVE